MKSQAIVFLAAILILMPTASAYCMSTGDIVFIMEMEDKLNITDNRLLDLFDTVVCNRTYDKAEIDDRLDAYGEIVDLKVELMDAKIDGIDFGDVDERVDNRMQNYTNWFEGKIDLNYQREMLAAIYNQTKVNMTAPVINDSAYVRIGDYESRLEDIEADVMDNKNRLNNPYSATGYTSYAAGDNSWMAWLGGIVVVILVGAFILNFFGILKVPKRQPAYTPPMAPAASTRGIDEKQTIGNAKRARALEFAKNLKIERLQKDMKDCQKLEDKKERTDKFTALEKELEALTEDDD